VCDTPARHVSQINNLRAKFDGSVIGVGSRISKIAQIWPEFADVGVKLPAKI
jgi:hypothetical protein